jgi:hypothetical protein
MWMETNSNEMQKEVMLHGLSQDGYGSARRMTAAIKNVKLPVTSGASH